MQLGMVGLGKMGGNIARRLTRDGHEIIGFDHNPATKTLLPEISISDTLEDLIARLNGPRCIWLMLPAGAPTESTVEKLYSLLSADDLVIDGGNSFYKDDIRRARYFAHKGIDYMDVGTSGGVWGIERGFCMMIGGSDAGFDRMEPIFASLAPGRGTIAPTAGRDSRDPRVEQGYMHTGKAGSGHFVKMVHNGIEYGLMQAYAEGFDILRGRAAGDLPDEERFDLDLADIAEVWRRGSVVSSWLLDLTAMALAESPTLETYSGAVSDSGEGRWTVQAAIEEAVPAPVLSAALYARFRSRIGNTFGEKLLSAMRHKFGGHVEVKKDGLL